METSKAMDGQSTGSDKRGRRQAIPQEAFGLVFTLYGEGLGYRAIADRLAEMRVCYPTKSSVERLIKALPPYQGRRVRAGSGDGPTPQ